MKYPGNEDLAEEIRGRILNTFRQTLDLAQKGDLREAQLGCDFVLRLDPLFEPARELGKRLGTGSASIQVSDLLDAVGGHDAAPVAPSPQNSTPPVSGEPPTRPAAPKAESGNASSVRESDSQPLELDSALDLSALEEAHSPEEPKPAGAPAGEPAAVAGQENSEPIAALDNESEQRVQDLLDEGQAAFDQAEYQAAIDSWSRIFLIDIDHPEANRRIDLARKLKAEVERKLEETFHIALTHVEAGRLEEARAGFEKVLTMMPGHIPAREYLERLDSPDFVSPAEAKAADPGEPDRDGFDEALEGEAGFADELAPSDPSAQAPVSAEARSRPAISGIGRASKPTRSANRTFRNIGAAALLVFAVVGWFVYKNWNSFFPNASEAVAPVQLDPVTRAKRTYAEAGAAIAIAQLRRLSPGHPQYDEAQALLAKWEAALDANKPETEAPEPLALAARDELVAQGLTAYRSREYLRTQELLERAAGQAPLDQSTQQLLDEAKSELEPMRAEISMFRDGEWQMALRNLWRMWEAGSQSPDVRRLMVDAYFNLGVRDLQRQDTSAALANFEEARELNENDPDLDRLIEFARVYQDQPEDLLYRIFVKYLPFR